MRIAGVMSGTSLDGIDVAMVEVLGRGIRTIGFLSTPYSEATRAAILAVSAIRTTWRSSAAMCKASAGTREHLLSRPDQHQHPARCGLTSQDHEDHSFDNTRCRSCDNFLYGFKGAPSGRASRPAPGRTRPRKREFNRGLRDRARDLGGILSG